VQQSRSFQSHSRRRPRFTRRLHVSVAAALVLATMAWTSTILTPPAAHAAVGDWPQFREAQTHQADANNETAISPGDVSTLAVAWTGATGGAVNSSPAIINGLAYVGSSDGKLYAFAVGCATGGAACTPVWTGTTGGAITSSPSVNNGRVFVGSADGKLYAYSATCGTGGASCTPLWTGTTSGAITSSPAIDAGIVYVGSADGTLYAYDATGAACSGTPGVCSPIWTGATGGAVESSPAVGATNVFVGSDDGKLYSFAIGCGTGGASCLPVWTATTGGAVHSSPSLESTNVFVGSLDGNLYAYDATGVTGCSGTPVVCTPLWVGATGAPIDSSPGVGSGHVYVGSGDGKIYAFHVGCATGGATCSPDWTGNIGHAIHSSSSTGNGVLFVGADDGSVYAYDAGCGSGGAACSPLWSHSIGTAVESSPSIAGGVMYVGSSDGKLYAFNLTIDHLVLSPATSSVPAGATQTYSAEGFDALNHDLGDVTAIVTFTISGSGSCSVNQCGASTAGDYTVTGTYLTATGTASLTVQTTGSTFVPLTPTRILDSRVGTGLSGNFRSHVARTFQVTGHGGVPANATAVTGNLTVTQQTTLGFLYIGPVAENDPTSSTLNFPVGDDRANGVDVVLGAGGTLAVTFASPSLSATAQVIFDVSGYFVPDMSGATYHAVTPTRLLDSRYGTGLSGTFSSHVARQFQVTGGVVPSNATAVTGNLTVTQQTSIGFLYIGPNLINDPVSSTLNFPKGDDRANNVTVQLAAGGMLDVTFAGPTLGPTAHVIFDVTGYFTADATGATFVPLTPTRLLDSRYGTGLANAFSSHVARPFQVTGTLIPSSATAVTGNLTVTQQTSLGFLYIGPVSQNNPTSSTLNFPKGDDRANGVTVALGSGGQLSVTYAAPTLGPTAHVIFDVTGYFTP
jgi:outer membrane protein assembly factor BamB